jgi:hypothetical protein
MAPNTSDPRKHYRQDLNRTLVLDDQGTCRVFNLSLSGVSFGCAGYRAIPERLIIDIVDDKGLHLLDLPIHRIWSAKNQDVSTAAIYDTIVGAKFTAELSPNQQSALNQLLEFFHGNNLQ